MSTTHKVTIDKTGLRNLLVAARRNKTVDAWAEIAMEWIDAADEEIGRLTAALAKMDARHD